jgi:hypothetical protein
MISTWQQEGGLQVALGQWEGLNEEREAGFSSGDDSLTHMGLLFLGIVRRR